MEHHQELNQIGSYQTTMEKIANNLFTIVIARGAMIITPFLFWFVWDAVNARIEALESVSIIQQRLINEHETRLVVGKSQREEFQRQSSIEFSEIGDILKELQVQVGVLNGNIIRLQTTVDGNKSP